MKPDKETGLPYLRHDLNMRLSHTVVMYRDRPLFIREVEDLTLFGRYLDSQRGMSIELPDDGLSLLPVPLGMVNHAGHGALYCTRIPRRMYKQGLHVENFNFTGIGARRVPDTTKLLCSVELADCIAGLYPTLEQVCNMIDLDGISRAFHRRWAVCYRVGHKLALYWRGNAVGEVKDGEPVLDEAYQFLTEELGDAL